MSEKEHPFYEELDRHKNYRRDRTLSFWVLAIFFIILIALSEVGLFWLGSALKSRPNNPFSVKGVIPSDLGAGVVPDNKDFTISQGVICSNLNKALGKELECAITPEHIVLSGKLSELLPENTSAYLVPEVSNGKINLKVIKLLIGKLPVSTFVAWPISASLERALASGLPENAKVSRIDLGTGFMVIVTESQIP